MELKDIVSVSGVAGLHKIIGRNKNGLIVETIGDNKKFATNMRQRVSVLADIAIFTEDGEAKLWEVIKSIKALQDDGKTIPTAKASDDEARAFMKEILPQYDMEKVYVSDMKKLYGWYQIVKDVIDYSKLGVEEDAEATESGTDAPVKEAKKAAPKKTNKTAAPKTMAGAKVKTTTPRKMGS